MRLPVIKAQNNYKRQVIAFGGLNLTQAFNEGELREITGLTHKEFPNLTQVSGAELEFSCNKPTAMCFGKEVCVAAEDGLYYGGKKVGDLSPGEKSLVEIGNKIIVFPDKVYYDTNEETFNSMEGKCELDGITTTFSSNSISVPDNVYETLKKRESNTYEPEFKVFRYADVSVDDGKIIFGTPEVITAAQLNVNDIYSESSGKNSYREVTELSVTDKGKIVVLSELVSVRNFSKNIFLKFRAGDVVEITGSITEENNKEAVITEVTGNIIVFADGTFTEKTETSAIVIKRKVPDFSCVCSYENRLWGCEGNTVYASKLGDPLNFSVFNGLSTDSFTVESNSAGEFTAAVVYGNYCLFFKEDKCYKLYGDRPSNFKLTESFGAGISKADARSIVNINGTLLYKGNGGVYSFYGGFPQSLSEKLGDHLPENCSAGSDGESYYLCGDYNGRREEFVYDTRTGLWSKSGNRDVLGYFLKGGIFYRLKEDGIFKINDSPPSDAEWVAEFCPFNENYHKAKNYSRLYITAELFENAWITAEISCDGGLWQTVMTRHGTKKEYINIPCIVKSCHELRVRLSGKGKSRIESLIREFSIN